MAEKVETGKESGLLRLLRRLSDSPWFGWSLIVFSAVYLAVSAMQCLDLADDGMLLSACQWFGEDPSAALCGSGYPLTCYVGWLLGLLYPEGGILYMRLWGVLLIVVMEVAAFLWLRRWFSAKWVALGLLMQVVYMGGDSRLFGYNTFTAFFGFFSLVLLVEGCLRRRVWMLLAGGLVAGVGVFARLPNVVFVAYAALPFFLWKNREGEWHLWRLAGFSAVFLVGFACGCWLGWLWMEQAGIGPLIANFFGSIGGELDGESTHSMSGMLQTYEQNYLHSLHCIFFLFLAIFLGGWAMRRGIAGWLVGLLLIVASQVLYRGCYIASDGFGDRILAMMNGIGIAGAVCFVNKGERLRLMALGAVLLSLLCPAGSDRGFQVVWMGTLLSLPIGLSGLYRLLVAWQNRGRVRKKEFPNLTFQFLDFTLQTSDINWNRFKLSNINWRNGFLFSIFCLLFIIFLYVEHRPFFDPYNRYERTHAVASPRAKGIFTTEKKAAILNPLLAELPKYVEEGDTTLFYDFSPMLYYLTRTKPFAGISWPCMYVGSRYIKAVQRAEKKAQRLPVVVLQQFYSSFHISDVDTLYLDHLLNPAFSTPKMKHCFHRFLSKNDYKAVWTNDYYTIFLPPERMKSRPICDTPDL